MVSTLDGVSDTVISHLVLEPVRRRRRLSLSSARAKNRCNHESGITNPSRHRVSRAPARLHACTPTMKRTKREKEKGTRRRDEKAQGTRNQKLFVECVDCINNSPSDENPFVESSMPPKRKRAADKRRKASSEEATTTSSDDDQQQQQQDISASVGEFFTRNNAKTIAATVLAILPAGATLKHVESQTILQAFDLIKAELKQRTKLLGAYFCGGAVNLSEDVFKHILDYLSTSDLVHRASLVSSVWLDCSRSPQMWNTMDPKHGMKARSKQTKNMTSLIQLLNRPQFSSLKKLVPPLRVRSTQRGFGQIAQACPLLEEIEIGYVPKSKLRISDSELVRLPSLFPHLQKVNFSMFVICNNAVVRFVEAMAGRLVQLHVSVGGYGGRAGNGLSDVTLESIARNCPNLESFHYGRFSLFSPHDSTPITEQGVIDLVRGCSNLKSIALCSSQSIGLGAFEHIASSREAQHLCHLEVTGNSALMLNQDLRDRLCEKVEECILKW
jgi:hypothetical protein